MNNGRLLAIFIAAATLILVVVGTLWPIQSAVAMSNWGDASLLHSSSTPEAAVENLAHDIGRLAWARAYSSTGQQRRIHAGGICQHDLTGKLSQPAQYCDPGRLRGEAAACLRG